MRLIKLYAFFLFAIQVNLIFISNVKCIQESNGATKNNSCRNFIIISTVDGIVTALDMNTGEKCWSILLDSEMFLSSSLSELEIYENDRRVWLVPSLDGGLYKYDNFSKMIQPLPVNVDSLISHSAFLDPSSTVIGGKIKIVFGLNRLTGEIIYTCKMNECNIFKTPLPENILIVEEIIQHVDAIDLSKAVKKWHFRVVELKMKVTSEVSNDNTSAFHGDAQENALIPRNFMEFINVDIYKISLQNGFAGMLNKSTQEFSWLFKTSSPITDAWYVKDNIINILDPFNKESGFFSIEMDDGKHTALLFLGTFKNQMFIKKSKKFPVENMNFNSLSTTVLYETYLFPVCPKIENKVSVDHLKPNEKDLMPSSMNFNATDYGSFYFMNYSVTENTTHCIINTNYILKYENTVHWNFWLFSLYIIACCASCLTFLKAYQAMTGQNEEKKFVNTGTSSANIAIDKQDSGVDGEFRSRFHQDFELLSLLGKGGFGIVMDVRNKIDDCRYAVKRIHLHEHNLHKEKVLREVKALAKLDHHGIVRYFNAWIEYPPVGWQNQKDKECTIQGISGSSSLFSLIRSTELGSSFKDTCFIPKPEREIPHSAGNVSKSNIQKKLNQNPLQLFEEDLLLDHHGKLECSKSESSSSKSDESTNASCINQMPISRFFNPGIMEQSSSEDESNLDILNKAIRPCDREQSSSDDISIVFENTVKDLPEYLLCEDNFGQIVTDTSNSQEAFSSNDSERDTHFLSKVPVAHIECYKILRSFNESLACSLDLESFNALSSYFFHDMNSLGISVTERSDWTEAIKGYRVSKNIFPLFQWLTSILCVIISSEDFTCTLEMTNLCYILSYMNECLQSSYFTEHISLDKSVASDNVLRRTKSKTKKSDEGYLYIQMQLCQKESLRDWLDQNCNYREYNKVMEIFSEIVDAMHYVHSSGLMHRDLKPSNIYFSLEGAIKIGDFGLATSSEIQVEAGFNNQNQSFVHTSHIGTEIYMSPEQKLEKDYDCKTDIYSLGIILFELLVPLKTVSERVKVLLDVRRCQFPPEFIIRYQDECKLLKQLLEEFPDKRPTTNEIKKHLLFIKSTAGRNE